MPDLVAAERPSPSAGARFRGLLKRSAILQRPGARASALRCPPEDLYAAIRRDGGTAAIWPRMQTRTELYATIGYEDCEALDASIVATVVPGAPA